MAKLGSRKRPAVVRVRSFEQADLIMYTCEIFDWEVIVGIEPDEPEDISEVEQLLGSLPDEPAAPRLPPKVSPNDYCPCRSGKKFKKCCGVAALAATAAR